MSNPITIITYTCPDCGHTTDVLAGVTTCGGCGAPLPATTKDGEMFIEDARPPEWAAAYFNECRDLLGIGVDWNLWLRFVEMPGASDEDEPDSPPTADGNCKLDARYLEATIEVRRGLGKQRVREVIMHELLHVAIAPIDLAADRIRELLPVRLWIHAGQLMIDAKEQAIERLTRSLQRSIKPSDEPKEEA